MSGTYTVVASNSSNCSVTATVPVSVTGSVPTMVIDNVNPISVCPGGTISVAFTATGTGQADIVNRTTREIFEIKRDKEDQAKEGVKQLKRYVSKANEFCNQNISPVMIDWKAGTRWFVSRGTKTEIWCPFWDNTSKPKKLVFWLDSIDSGLIRYDIIDNINPKLEPVPRLDPSVLPDTRETLKRILQEVAKHPTPEKAREVARENLKGLATGALVGLIAGGVVAELAAIAEEIGSVGIATPVVVAQAVAATAII